MKHWVITTAVVALFLSNPVSAEPLKNDDVIKLIDAGLGDEAVIAKIETEEGDYQTDVDTLLSLRDAGLSSSVIAAMVKKASAPVALSDSSPDPLVPHYAGVYLMDEWSEEPQMLRIDPTTSTQTKTGGLLGYAITGGIASASVKAVIPGSEAKHRAPKMKPVFYAYMNSSEGNNAGTFSTGFGSAVQSPNEFSLVKLKQKKNRREARIGSLNIAGAKAGVMDKDQIAFSYEQVAPGVFKITPDQDLEEGEYGFVFAVTGGAGPSGSATGAGGGARVFAFGISED